MICCGRKRGLGLCVKDSEAFKFTPNPCEQPALGWHGLESQGRCLVLAFHSVASKFENTESPSLGMPFLSINNDKLYPHSLSWLPYVLLGCITMSPPLENKCYTPYFSRRRGI